MVISINCMVGLSDELVGSFVEVVIPTTIGRTMMKLVLPPNLMNNVRSADISLPYHKRFKVQTGKHGHTDRDW